MKKENRGMKHRCTQCSALFYDLGRSPIVCPKCGVAVQVQIQAKGRKARGLEEEKEELGSKSTIDESLLDEDGPSEALGDDDLLEDASELGDEKDEVNEVIEDAEPSDGDED